MLKQRIKDYWSLIKSLQTFLLLITGMAGYTTYKCPIIHWKEFLLMTLSLFLAISGTTVLNMVYDRERDAKMERTKNRPIPSGRVSPKEALIFGWVILLLGLGIAYYLSPLFALIVFAGFFIDFVIYTLWLKPRSEWSIVWGGISGGMPILAGRTLAVGTIDLEGILLAAGILFWIPTHIITFNIKYLDDYNRAGIPTFPQKYGIKPSRWIVAASSIVSALSFSFVAYILGLSWGFLRVIIILGIGLIVCALYTIVKPTEKNNFVLFKFASIYMLLAMIIISIASIIKHWSN